MELIDKATIQHFHRHRLQCYAPDGVQALGYRHQDSQSLRFKALADMAVLDHHTVLDVGCGHGDLKGYLDTRFHNFNYIGIDFMPEFIATAQQRYGQRPACFFCTSDFTTSDLPPADYIFACGVLAYRSQNPQFHEHMIEKLFHSAQKGLGFNMLHRDHFPEHPLLHGHDPQRIFEFCSRISPKVELITGYLDDDFSIWMYH